MKILQLSDSLKLTVNSHWYSEDSIGSEAARWDEFKCLQNTRQVSGVEIPAIPKILKCVTE